MTIRPETATDFYKTGHIRQYSKGTTFVYSNFTCRSDRLASVLPDFDHKVVFFGLQGVLKSLNDLWKREFFSKPKEVIVARYQRRMDRSLGPGAVKVEHIAALHDLGYLPILIKALPEGSRVNMRVALWTIQNTLPEFFWLTNYLETQLSAECWKPVHSATIAYEWCLFHGKDTIFRLVVCRIFTMLLQTVLVIFFRSWERIQFPPLII